MKYTRIDFIGQIINEKEAREAGYTMGLRWSSLSKKEKEKYRKKAEQMFEEWQIAEYILDSHTE